MPSRKPSLTSLLNDLSAFHSELKSYPSIQPPPISHSINTNHSSPPTLARSTASSTSRCPSLTSRSSGCAEADFEESTYPPFQKPPTDPALIIPQREDTSSLQSWTPLTPKTVQRIVVENTTANHPRIAVIPSVNLPVAAPVTTIQHGHVDHRSDRSGSGSERVAKPQERLERLMEDIDFGASFDNVGRGMDVEREEVTEDGVGRRSDMVHEVEMGGHERLERLLGQLESEGFNDVDKFNDPSIRDTIISQSTHPLQTAPPQASQTPTLTSTPPPPAKPTKSPLRLSSLPSPFRHPSSSSPHPSLPLSTLSIPPTPSNLPTSLAECHALIKEVQTQHSESVTQMLNYAKMASDWEGRVAELEEIVGRFEGERVELVGVVRSLEEERKELERRLGKVDRQREELTGRLKQMEKNYAIVGSHNTELKIELDSARKGCYDLEVLLDGEVGLRKRLEAQIINLEADKSINEREWTAKILDLEQTLSTLNSENLSWKSSLQSSETHAKTITTLQTDLVHLSAKLQETERARRDLFVKCEKKGDAEVLEEVKRLRVLVEGLREDKRDLVEEVEVWKGRVRGR
ncbi:hypothetical protein HK097_009288 [Rhizophlyctis rosea]|uniref:Uncharacterized protein n=1 Tax=Rhizophlyctis rosea TaxID=64517 RepID=A0AAD5X478_9FUNG|nr:hypothetical protein HK097_009288 [Rhizophlyctis rosea]